MLKNKRTVSACSLSSCRIRAEALARAFNTRIWPCVWIPSQRSSAEGDDGMPNGIDDEEEFFDASPSPVEVEDESLFCQQHSSAATEAGRAKLYELLQQHATDDAIDVFYDVSEEAGVTDASDTCLKNDGHESDQVDNTSSSSNCDFENESNFSSKLDLNNGEVNELTCVPANQVFNDPINSEVPDSRESEVNSGEQENAVLDPSTQNSPNCENCPCLQNVEKEIREETTINDDNSLQENENSSTGKGNKFLSEGRFRVKKSVVDENGIPLENRESIVTDTIAQNVDLKSENADKSVIDTSENASNTVQDHVDNISDSANAEKVSTHDEESNVAIKVTSDIDSPTALSDTSDKASSPTSRLQVFDEIRPKISRSTSLKTGKTPPGTPSRKKIVRFADVLGLDLEDVRHIMTGDVPIVPSSAYTDLNLKDVVLPRCEPISETVEISRRDFASWNSLAAAASANVLYPMFPIPGEQTDFMDRVRSQGICLETMIISEMSIQCTCRVMNYGYHKKVIARYTFNDWQSSNDIDASYVSGSSDGETDIFAFSIFLSPCNKSVKFALKYEVNGREYWDSNKSQNYHLTYHGNYNMQHLSSSSWQHQFW